MFDKEITLTSSDGTVSIDIVAGTEGVKCIVLHAITSGIHKTITQQQLIDICAPALKAWADAPMQ